MLYISSDDPTVVNDFAKYHPISAQDLNVNIPKYGSFFPDYYVLMNADLIAISNSTFSFTASMFNAKAKQFLRPDFTHQTLRTYDPWNDDPFDHSSK